MVLLPVRRRRALLAVVLGVAVLVTLTVATSRYQPVGYGSIGSADQAFPGLPVGTGIRQVNTLGMLHDDFYIPPQRGTFSLFADLTNNGVHPVTIVSVSLPRLAPLTLAGPVRYSTPGMGGSHQIPPPASRVLRDVILRPGQDMFLGFPVRMWPCVNDQGWEAVTDFFVTIRYLVFTRTVAIPWGPQDDSLITRSVGGRPGQKGVTCAAGTTLANLPKVPGSAQPRTVAGTIIRISKGGDTGELRLMEMTRPDAAESIGGRLPPCFLQYPADQAHPPAYRVVSFDLNWAGINVGQRGPAPAVKVTIAGPDGQPMIAAVPGRGGDSIDCQAVESFRLGTQRRGWQLVYGLTLRVPQHTALNRLLVTLDGHTITVPLVRACGDGAASARCFDGDELGGPWIAGTIYSVSLGP